MCPDYNETCLYRCKNYEKICKNIYKTYLKPKAGARTRYNAMKKYFTYNKSSRACLSKPYVGIEFEGETYPVVKLEISSTSHPFYTGKSKLVDTAGRVDKFMSRYAQARKK